MNLAAVVAVMSSYLLGIFPAVELLVLGQAYATQQVLWPYL